MKLTEGNQYITDHEKKEYIYIYIWWPEKKRERWGGDAFVEVPSLSPCRSCKSLMGEMLSHVNNIFMSFVVNSLIGFDGGCSCAIIGGLFNFLDWHLLGWFWLPKTKHVPTFSHKEKHYYLTYVFENLLIRNCIVKHTYHAIYKIHNKVFHCSFFFL